MCTNLCKMPTQTFIKDSLGMPINMVPSKYFMKATAYIYLYAQLYTQFDCEIKLSTSHSLDNLTDSISVETQCKAPFFSVAVQKDFNSANSLQCPTKYRKIQYQSCLKCFYTQIKSIVPK